MKKHVFFRPSSPLVLYTKKHPDNPNSAIFFASNNTREINLRSAFNKLEHNAQQRLEHETNKFMQEAHLDDIGIEECLGTYRMAKDKHITADNSEKIITHCQHLPREQIFKIAMRLANDINQESVALFIPDPHTHISHTVLELKSANYTIQEIVENIHSRLPEPYVQAFSLHLNNHVTDFQQAIVSKVEWLGSKLIHSEIQKSFPFEEVNYQKGHAYLVYKNGKVKAL